MTFADVQQYACVALYDRQGYFLCVRKERPDWQRGKLNLPGGKVEPNETPHRAALRELYEETGIEAPSHEVRMPAHYLRLIKGGQWEVNFYKSEVANIHRLHKQQRTDEKLVHIHVGAVNSGVFGLDLCAVYGVDIAMRLALMPGIHATTIEVHRDYDSNY